MQTADEGLEIEAEDTAEGRDFLERHRADDQRFKGCRIVAGWQMFPHKIPMRKVIDATTVNVPEDDIVTTRVMYRTDRHGEDPRCFALLLDTVEDCARPGKPERMMAYAHVGQHFEVDYSMAMGASRPAVLSEYTPLHRELVKLGYNLTICRRVYDAK